MARQYFFGHIINTSSMYLEKNSGFCVVVLKNFLKKTDINIFATVGEYEAPIVVPVVWWNVNSAKVK